MESAIEPDSVKVVRPSPSDIDIFLPWACAQLGLENTIVINRILQRQYVSVTKDRPKTKEKDKVKHKTRTTADSTSNVEVMSITPSDSNAMMEEENSIYIETVYDEHFELVGLKFPKNPKIPRLVLKIVGLAIPYHKALTSITFTHCLRSEAIHEISHYFNKNRITEICLDNNFIAEANYHILLDNNVLKHLSISRCNITDNVVKSLASKLIYNLPASSSLRALNLSINIITDVGAKYLAEMLRTNRHLSYLNLAGNRITDEGACSIFETLTKFTLTKEETTDKTKRLVAYLNLKNELILKTVEELRFSDFDKKPRKKTVTSKPTTAKKKLEKEMSIEQKSFINGDGNLTERAEVIVQGILGAFNDPFGPENIEIVQDEVKCLGNNTLSYLNIAYNELSYCSLKKICSLLKSQRAARRKPQGLINIKLEGNLLPDTCIEYQIIDDLLMFGLTSQKSMESTKKKAGSSGSRY